MKKIHLIIFFFCLAIISRAQTLGGNTVFNFLSQPNTAQLSALGGVNISNIGNDAGMSFQNPALLRPQMNQQLNTSFNDFFAGIKNYSLTSAFYLEKPNTSLSVGVNYFDYGIITQTDASGNILGIFHPNDYVVQLSASKQYKERWWYGTTFKFISSNYAQYTSNGIAFDIGVAYYDSANFLQAGVAVKNIGTQLKTYDGSSQRQELPFDLEFGITKRLQHAPIQFSLTMHHIQAFNIYYNDTVFNAAEGIGNSGNNGLQKVMDHLILSAQFFISNKIEATAAYNFLRRDDLNAYSVANGLNGFTFGAGVLLKKLHIRYATGFYQQNMFHQFSLNFNWKGNDL
jgi:hypothetical protein